MTTLFDLPPEHSAYESARVAVLPVPYDGTASYRKGSALGPAALVEASCQVETYDQDTDLSLEEIGIHLLRPVEQGGPPEGVVDRVAAATARVLADGKFPVGLGGDHTAVTTGAVRAVLEAGHRPLAVLVIDAHLDLRDEYEGSRYSHACNTRRLVDLGAEVLVVGARSWSVGEQAILGTCGAEAVWATHLVRGRVSTDDVVNHLLPPAEEVYLSIDLDGLDPSVMPAVGTPEPGGLGWHFTLDLIAELCRERTVVGADIVELCPIAGDVRGDFAAARLLAKLLCRRFY